jgi:hypothetical protein
MRYLNLPYIALLATVSSLALSGCSGGSSGTAAAASSNSPLKNIPAGTVLTAPRGEGLESATLSYTGSNITGATINPAALASDQLTITPNSDGSVDITIPAGASSTGIADALHIPKGSFTNDTNTGAGFVAPAGTQEAVVTTTGTGGTPTAADILIFDKTVAATATNTAAGLQYSEFGFWSAPNDGTTQPTVASVFGFGQKETAAMPVTGTATYTGVAAGAAVNNAHAAEWVGTANMTANFAANTVGGTITGINVTDANHDTQGSIVGTMNNITMAGATISGATFAGSTTGTATIAATGSAGTFMDITGANTGRFGGTFNGPTTATAGSTPQEVAGTFSLSGGGNNAKVIGSFGAKN